MRPELSYLLSAVGLYLVMIVVQAVAATVSGKASVGELVGARDTLPPQGLSTLHGRARRAQANFTEGMVMFVPLVFVAYATDQFTALTATGAALFFYGRLAFAPLYYFGTPWLRTIAWFVSVLGILLFLWELVL